MIRLAMKIGNAANSSLSLPFNYLIAFTTTSNLNQRPDLNRCLGPSIPPLLALSSMIREDNGILHQYVSG